MPLIQPTLPMTPIRPVARGDTPAQYPAASTAASLAPKDNETGNKAVEPAAPPSVLQLQIKALISEQAQSLQDQSEPDPEAPS